LQNFQKFHTFFTLRSCFSRCLERHTGVRLAERLVAPSFSTVGGPGGGGARPRSPVAADDIVRSRLQSLADSMSQLVDEIGARQAVSGLMVRVEIEKMMRTLRDVDADACRTRDAFRAAVKQKQRFEGEALSLLRSYQEIRRLEREIKVSQLF
jgi:hypothetical protein